MSLHRMKSFMLCVGAFVVMGLMALPVYAATVTAAIPVSGTFATQISGTGTMVVSANFNVKLSQQILGTAVSVTVPINIPSQTNALTLVPNPTNVNQASSGTFTVTLADANGNGLADEGAGVTPAPIAADGMLDAVVNDLDVTLINSASLQTNTVNLGGTASLDILGITTVNLPVSVDLNAETTLQNVLFDGVLDGAVLFGKSAFPSFGIHPFHPFSPDLSAQWGLALIPGFSEGEAIGSVNADLEIDLGIFGTVGQSISGLGAINQPFGPELIPLLGELILQHIPTANAIHDDLQAFFNVALDAPLDFDLSLADTQVFNTDFDLPVDLGILGGFTLDGDVTGTVNFSIDFDLTIANTSLNVSGTESAIIEVIPEPSTWCLMALALLGIVPIVRRKFRK